MSTSEEYSSDLCEQNQCLNTHLPVIAFNDNNVTNLVNNCSNHQNSLYNVINESENSESCEEWSSSTSTSTSIPPNNTNIERIDNINSSLDRMANSDHKLSNHSNAANMQPLIDLDENLRFNQIGEHSVKRSETDILTSLIKNQFSVCKQQFEAKLTETEARFEEYIQRRELSFLTELKCREDAVEKKFDSMVSKLVANMDKQLNKGFSEMRTELKSQLQLLNNDIELNQNSFQDCIKSINDIERAIKEIPMKHSLSHFDANRLCEPIFAKLSKEMRIIVQNCFDNFKKTIVDEKILEIGGYDKSVQHKPLLKLDTTSMMSPLMNKCSTAEQCAKVKDETIEMINKGYIKEAFIKALNLGDSAVLSQLCKMFENEAEKLVSAFDDCVDSQSIYISILDHLFNDGVFNQRWKIRVIAVFMVRLDINDEIGKKSLPGLALHWSAVLDQIAIIGGPHSNEAKLLSISFGFLTSDN